MQKKRNVTTKANLISKRLFACGRWLLLATLFCTVRAEGKDKMSFMDAASPYRNENYNENGYVDSAGAVKNGGLGCSGYAVAVLYRMQNGDNWKTVYKADWDAGKKAHQWYGDKIAKHFQLGAAITVKTADASSDDKIKSLIRNGNLRADGLYLFNLRSGSHGHVGFLRVKSEGALEQYHYSGIGRFNGLATGDFRGWKKSSMYKDVDLSLYRIAE